MSLPDDTQPRSPFKDTPPPSERPQPERTPSAPTPPRGQPPVRGVEMASDTSSYPNQPYQPAQPQRPYAAPAEPRGPGCLVWGVLGVTILAFGLLIVGLSATAGWTAGQRVAGLNATATIGSKIAEQIGLIETDVASRNEYVVAQRLEFLAQLTPGVGGVAELRATATALYITAQPTVTPTPTLTPTPTPTTEATEIVVAEVTEAAESTSEAASAYDLEGLLAEAQEQLDLGEYDDAIETLDAIIRIDENYQRQLVRTLITEALNTRAIQLYRSVDTLAEAIRLTDLVTQYGGTLAEGLDYERLVASLYLDSVRAVGTNNHQAAIRALGQLIRYQTQYQGINLNQLLFDEYLAYGRAFAIEGNHCSAAGQFQAALGIFNNGEAQAALQTSQTLCQQGTPTPDPLVPPTPGT
ncbi:MAG: hypothetical protein SF029_13720 [bacterium]|nr:hypothetical protein [bacterium]